MIKIGGQFSGVGAFDQALQRLGIDYLNVYQAEWDKYARQTYLHNYEKPIYYVNDVHDTPTNEITEKYDSLDIVMFSPPCQAFSLAGKRLGKDDKRGILFFNSHEFIQVNKPRFFIFENVKGLLSDDGGKTFSEWVNMLGGKSVNGNAVLFPYEDSVSYHIYWQVLNSKEHGVPQNRERVFIVGIRDDKDNSFMFPKEETLTKRLKDVLEEEVDDKYFLSEKMINGFMNHNDNHNTKGTGFIFEPKNENDIAACLRANAALCPTDNSIKVNKVGFINQDTQASVVYEDNGISQKMSAGTHGYAMGYIQIKSATSKGYEEATERVMIGAFRGRNPDNPSDRTNGSPTEQRLEINKEGTSNTITSVQKDNMVIDDYKIRRLTPRECFRLMDFPDTFTWNVSDSQAYKQAGNSIVVNVLFKIIKNLNL